LRKSTGFTTKTKTVFSQAYGDVTLREFSGSEACDGAVMVEGFPSVSLTSLLTAGYLREQLDLPLIGCIASPKFPPRCVIEGGVPIHPIRLFGNKYMVVVLCEFKLPTAELTYDVVQALLNFSERHKISNIITVEGLPMEQFDPASQKTYDNKLAFVSTSQRFSEKMLELGHEPLMDSVIVGVTGLILAEASLTPTDVSCLIAPTSTKYPDASSTVAVVRTLSNYLTEITIDIAPLEKKAAALQQSVQQLLQKEKTGVLDHNSMYT
jgi:predicted ATP-grasp superfamily ATP-dependent carboligase